MTKSCRDRVLDFYEKDNRELHRRFFGFLEYDEIFARPGNAPEAERIHEQVEGLKDILSIQLGLLLSLLNKGEQASLSEESKQILELSTWPTPSSIDAHGLYAHRPESDVA